MKTPLPPTDHVLSGIEEKFEPGGDSSEGQHYHYLLSLAKVSLSCTYDVLSSLPPIHSWRVNAECSK